MLSTLWVRSFATVVDLGGFTRAADELGLTQAAVSQHIAHLEKRYGALLIRRPRRLELTPTGEALLSYAREIAGAERRLESRLGGADLEVGEISLITPGSIGLFLYPCLLRYQQAHRGIAIRHRFAPDAEVLDGVLNTHFELGLLTVKPDDPHLSASPFAEEALELVLPAGEDVRDWTDLQRIGFIDHPDGQAMAARLLTRVFPRHPGLGTLPVNGFSNQIGLILEPVARGLGFTVLPRYARQAFPRQSDLRVHDTGGRVVDTLWLIHRAEWPVSARVARMIDFLRGEIDAPKAATATIGQANGGSRSDSR